MMTVALTTDTIARGGKERQLFLLANQLILKGYSVVVISLRGADPNYISEYAIPQECVMIVNGRSLGHRFLEYKDKIEKSKPDLLLSWDTQTALFSLLLSPKLGFKFINGSVQHGIRLFRVSHLIRSLVLWLSPYRLANSIAGLYANNLTPGPKSFVLYNGIENKFLRRYSGNELESRRAEVVSNYIPGNKVFISVGNFVPYKDYFTVLEALSRLSEHHGFRYLVLGDGPLREQVEAKVRQLRLEESVFLLGRVADVQRYLRISDCMIHSSRGEGISNAILEAMFCGLPVIATDVGGTRELMYEDSVQLFKYQDCEGLFRILSSVDQRFAQFNSEVEGYKQHLKKFEVRTMVDNFEKIMRSVLNE